MFFLGKCIHLLSLLLLFLLFLLLLLQGVPRASNMQAKCSTAKLSLCLTHINEDDDGYKGDDVNDSLLGKLLIAHMNILLSRNQKLKT